MNLGINKLVAQLQTLNDANVYYVSTPTKKVAIDFTLNVLIKNSQKDLLKFLALDGINQEDIKTHFHNPKDLYKVKTHVYENLYKDNFLYTLASDLRFMYVNRAHSLIVATFNDNKFFTLSQKKRHQCFLNLHQYAKDFNLSILLISYGLNQKEITSSILKEMSFLSGIAMLDVLPHQYALNTILWREQNGAISQGENSLDLNDNGFTIVDNSIKQSSFIDDNECYLTKGKFILDEQLFENIYRFDTNDELLEFAKNRVNAAFICFSIEDRSQIDDVCRAIYTMRTTRGNDLKIVVFEQIAGIRSKSEHFLLTCGANFIFESSAKSSYINAMIPILKTLRFNRTISRSFDNLLNEYHLLDREANGFLALDLFIQKVRFFCKNNLETQKSDGCLAILTCQESFSVQMCASQFTPKRGGDYCTIFKNNVILYLPSCRNGEISISLEHTFNVTPTTLFKNCQAFYKQQDILDKINDLSKFKYTQELDTSSMVNLLQLALNKKRALEKIKNLDEVATTNTTNAKVYDLRLLGDDNAI